MSWRSASRLSITQQVYIRDTSRRLIYRWPVERDEQDMFEWEGDEDVGLGNFWRCWRSSHCLPKIIVKERLKDSDGALLTKGVR